MFYRATNVWSWWCDISHGTDEISQKILATMIPLFIILLIIFSVKRQNKVKPPLPPGPHGLPLVGYLPFLGSDLHKSFNDLASRYGPIFKLQLGTKECIVLSSPSLVKEVVKDQDVIFANRDPSDAARIASFGTRDIAFSDYGLEWRKLRKIFVSEMLSNASLDASYYLRKQQVMKLINETYKKAGEQVDIGELAFLTITGSVMSMVWGETLKGDEDAAINAEFRAVVIQFMELLGAPNISDFFPFLARFDLQGIRRRMKMVSLQCEDP